MLKVLCISGGSKPKSKQPKDAMQDPFMITKLTFFSFFFGGGEMYSQMQSGNLIVPLLYFAQKSLINSSGQLFVKTDV